MKSVDKGILIIIPVYNEEKIIESVIKNLNKNGFYNILIVDDGSKDKSVEIINNLKIHTARHLINRGLGVALSTGIEIARILNPEIVVTFDADGQHDASDIVKLIEPIQENQADVVIGSRMLDKTEMPLGRKIYNIIANLITFLVYGFSASDTQSGLRAFNRRAYNFLNIECSGMECSSEIIYKIKNFGFRVMEVTIKTIYTDYSLSKGQGLRKGFKTFFQLMLSIFAKEK